MSVVRPRQLVHRGVVEAAALWLPEGARDRVLAAWHPGAAVERVAGGFVLHLAPGRRRCDTRIAPGVPLVARAGVLLAAPLSNAELHDLQPAYGAVVLVRGGLAEVHAGPHPSIDVSDWLDLSRFRTVDVTPLGPEPQATVVTHEIPPDIRRALGDAVSAPAQERSAVARFLRQISGDAGGLGSGASWIARALGTMGGWLGRLLGGPADTIGDDPRTAVRSAPDGRKDPEHGNGFIGRVLERARWLLASSQLMRWVGRRHADYLARMLDLFRVGDLAEALRHAVPLIKGGLDGTAPPALGVPSPRTDLQIRRRSGGGGSTIYLADGFLKRLRRIYRAAYERLEREGRVEEAAYVLAELLDEPLEAVAYLERRGRLHEAARVAEVRDLDPALRVRLWFLAGDHDRAVRIALHHNAFAAAVEQLERRRPEDAPPLRRLWGETAAAAGDYVLAVRAVWPVELLRPRARDWLWRAIEGDGVAGAQMLAFAAGSAAALRLDDEARADLRGRVLRLLAASDPDSAGHLRAFAAALVAERPTDLVRALARPAVRALVRDRQRFAEAREAPLLERLVRHTGEDALATDLPRRYDPPERAPLHDREPAKTWAIAASDAGATPLYELAWCGADRLLVGLGEAGARLVTRTGRTLLTLAAPTHRVVLSHLRSRALLLARRGPVWRVARFDVTQRRVDDWGEVGFDVCAPTFDGRLWIVGHDRRLLALDTTAAASHGVNAIWSIDDLPGPVRALRVDLGICRAWTGDEVWRLETTTAIVRDRAPAPRLEPGSTALGPDGSLASAWCETGVPGSLMLALAPLQGGSVTVSLATIVTGQAGAPSVEEGWIAVPVITGKDGGVYLADVATLQTRALIELSGSRRVCAHIDGNACLISDDRGRVLVIDLRDGTAARDLRL